MSEYAGIIGYFPSADSLNDAIKKAKAVGLSDVTAYLPLPDDAELEEMDSSQSLVRWFALAGGITGIGLALFMTIATSWQYPLVVGGKSITSWPPFLVICFEMMVLFGTFGALTGFLVLSHLPHVIPEDGYNPRLAIDTYGMFVPCLPTSPYRLEVERVMREAGAEEIRSFYRG
ncbi:MAG TPA: DUF3341 domain-containing protein [Armatimonadota bacterium]|nr:DUF3341 domain-containing protein [Armatimonadota bacterium]